ncbi:MAG: NAD(+)/NADH kinase [Pelovirga sp.]
MISDPVPDSSVGIIANPASGQDIRRLVSAASGYTIAEKTNIVRRLCLGMRVPGVTKVYLIPDHSGIAGSLLRSRDQGSAALGETWPQIELLDMPVEEKAIDTLRAVDLMVKAGVRLIVVLGGDGTHRLVADGCADIPLVALSTGTNNTFPQFQEATVAGIAAGLVATGAVPVSAATRRNKVLRVEIDECCRDLALVDLCLTDDVWIGSRAVWKPERVREIFVPFARPDAIGWSAVAGYVRHIPRESSEGLHLVLCPPGQGLMTLCAPIAPGLILPVGIAAVRVLHPLEVISLKELTGMVSLDGEREFTLRRCTSVKIWLDLNGPLTVDVPHVMTLAAERGLLCCPSTERAHKPAGLTPPAHR